jgi:hypothetical protein
MARRNDGTSKRYEFQLFDDEAGQGRAIYQAICDAQAKGVSAAEFIRQALWFFVCEGQLDTTGSTPQSQPESSADALAAVMQELAALREALSRPQNRSGGTEKAQPARSSIDAAETISPPPPTHEGEVTASSPEVQSSGIDMSSRRRGRAPAVSRVPLKPAAVQPLLDPQALSRQLITSIRAYGQEAAPG